MTTPLDDVPVRRPMPPVVYVPTTDEAEQLARRVVMHSIADGRVALYTYSAPDRVDEYYRPGTPWVLCDVAALQRIHDETPYDLLFVDVDPDLEDESGDGRAEESGA